MLEEPIVFALVLAGIWYATQTLSFSDTARDWLGNIFQGLIVLNVAWLISRLFDSLYREYLVPIADKSETDLDDHLLPILRKGTKIIVWALAIIVALNNAGYNVGAILAGLGIGGLALAMAAKDTVSNIFGGFTILTDRPFKIKDRIKVIGLDGIVEEIGLRSTRIRTLQGRSVLVPNSKFTDNPVENISSEPNRKVVLKLGLTYDMTEKQMNKALDILKKIASQNKNLEEKVIVSFNEFGDFALGILFIYYIKSGHDILTTQTEINSEILKQFNKNKLEMAFPTQTIYSKKG